MIFGWKCAFAIQDERVNLMEFDERKSFEVCGKVIWVEKTNDKFDFSYWEMFSHYKNLYGMEKLEKVKLNPLSSKQSQVNSHS